MLQTTDVRVALHSERVTLAGEWHYCPRWQGSDSESVLSRGKGEVVSLAVNVP